MTNTVCCAVAAVMLAVMACSEKPSAEADAGADAGLPADSGSPTDAALDASPVDATTPSPFLRVEEGAFVLAEVPIRLYAVNYLPHYVDAPDAAWNASQEHAWLTYDATVVEQNLADIAATGANAIRIWGPGRAFETDFETYDLTMCDRVNHLLNTAGANDLLVLFTFPHPTRYSPWFQNHFPLPDPGGPLVDPDFNQFLIDRHVALIQQCALADRVEIAGYDLMNEPNFGNEVYRNGDAAVAAWEAWVVGRYSTVNAAVSEWGYAPDASCGALSDQLCPPDADEDCTPGPWDGFVSAYHRFQRETADFAIAERAVQIRAIDPNHLLTLGHGSYAAGQTADPPEAGLELFCRERGAHLDPRTAHESLDFLSVHIYPWNRIRVLPDDPGAPLEAETSLARFEFALLYLDVGKPVVLGEFGYNSCFGAPQCGDWDDIQVAVFHHQVDTAIQIGVQGLFYWEWGDTAADARFGLVHLDGSLRPAHPAFVDRVTDFYNAPARPAPDFALLADPFVHGPVFDLYRLGVDRYVQLREAGHTVVLRSCAQIASVAECDLVEGCHAHCDIP